MDNTYLNKLYKAGTIFLFMLSLYVIVLGINAMKENKFIGGGVSTSNVLTVAGEGEVLAVPDIATFSFAVVEERKDVSTAQRQAAEKVNNIIAFFEERDIDEKDIKTTSFNVNPKYEYQRQTVTCIAFPCPQPPGKQVLIGYEVTQRISVKVRETDEAGAILSGVGERGATNVSGLTFTIDDTEALQDEARDLAIEDAQEKARDLARALDVRLVRVVDFSDRNVGYAPQPIFARSLAFEESVAPEISVGENQIVSNVTITYEIR